METWELQQYGVADLGERVRQRVGRQGWHHLPMVDGSIPDADGEAAWERIAGDLHDQLDAGGRLCIHCLGGLGRTGVIACRLLVERGVAPEQALRQVRAARRGAVETRQQEVYVRGLSPPV